MTSDDVALATGAATDIGCAREINEDAILMSAPVFAVADGMGGHAAGELAAAIALEELGRLGGRAELRTEDVTAAISAANDAVVQRAGATEGTAGMGTTLAGICLGSIGGSAHWFVFNIGDSRVYRFSDGALRQLSVDHSEVAELLAAGEITKSEARRHPRRNVITRSLGTVPAPAPDVWVLPVEDGETFVICSDGLVSNLHESVLRDVLMRDRDPQKTADELVSCALAARTRDNISVVVVSLATRAAMPDDDITAPRPLIEGAVHDRA